MCSAVIKGGRSADIDEICFQVAKRSDMECVELLVGLFADCHELNFRSRNVQIIAVPSCKRVDMLLFANSGFVVRKVKYVHC